MSTKWIVLIVIAAVVTVAGVLMATNAGHIRTKIFGKSELKITAPPDVTFIQGEKVVLGEPKVDSTQLANALAVSKSNNAPDTLKVGKTKVIWTVILWTDTDKSDTAKCMQMVTIKPAPKPVYVNTPVYYQGDKPCTINPKNKTITGFKSDENELNQIKPDGYDLKLMPR